MKSLLTYLMLLMWCSAYVQQDTMFVKYDENWYDDSLNYQTDTILYAKSTTPYFMTGTTKIPGTYNQMTARGYGLWFDKVTKSDCKSHGERVYRSEDKIINIQNTDSTLVIETNIFKNCCHEFLCDISVDSNSVLQLHYSGYGTYCACDCCFGLTFHLKKEQYIDYDDIKAIMLGDNAKTMKKVD